MSLPKQVAAQAAAVEAIEAKMAPVAEPPQPEAETPPAEPVTPQGPEPVAPTPPAEPKPPETDWQQKYSTLNGMFKAETTRQNTRIAELEKLVEKLSEPKPASEPVQPLVTDKDVEAFGSDLLDVVKRQATDAAREHFGEVIQRLEAENARLREQVSGVTEKLEISDRAMYFRELGKLVPDYEALNVDPGFLAWLQEVDPLSGVQRQAYLNDAFGKMDVERTATLFNAFKPAPAPTPQPPAVKPELERQIAPVSSKSGDVPSAAPHKIWTTREIEKFYADVSRGLYRSKPAEQARISAEIDAAVASGRIR